LQSSQITATVDRHSYNRHRLARRRIPAHKSLGVHGADDLVDRELSADGRLLHHARVRIGYPVARELDSPQLARPVRIWLLLMERVGPFEYR
jgi:hypothetical protein